MKFVSTILTVTMVASAAFAQAAPQTVSQAESTRARLNTVLELQDEVADLQGQVAAAKASIRSGKTTRDVSIVVAVGFGLLTAKAFHFISHTDIAGLAMIVPGLGAGAITLGAVGTAGASQYSIHLSEQELDQVLARLAHMQRKLEAKKADLIAKAN